MLLRMSLKYNKELEEDKLLYTAGNNHTINTHVHSAYTVVLYLNINDILLLFSNTVSRSAVYCVVSNAIEQCKTEGVVDVFQATKAVRIHKPGAVTTLVSIHLFNV